MSFLTSNSVGTVIPDSGVARFTFDSADTTSTLATDVWNGNDMSLNGGPTTGVSGANQTYSTNEAISTDGSDDEGNIDGSASFLDGLTEYTIGGWVKIPDGRGGLFGWRDGSSCDFYIWYLSSSSSLEIRVRTVDGLWTVNPSFSSYFDTWTHIIFTRNGSTMTVYINGSSAASDSGLSGGWPVCNYPFEFANFSANTENKAGDWDDLRLYSKGISSTEASNWYQNGSL